MESRSQSIPKFCTPTIKIETEDAANGPATATDAVTVTEAEKPDLLAMEVARLKLLGFDKQNPTMVREITSKGLWVLRWLMAGQLLADCLYGLWVCYTHARERSEWLLSSPMFFWLSLYSLCHFHFVLSFLHKLWTNYHHYNAYLVHNLLSSLFLVAETMLLTAYFLVHFTPAGTEQNWETITLYAISGSRFLASITIAVVIGNYTHLVVAVFNEKKMK